jgi:lysophospholipase L1-like esterase
MTQEKKPLFEFNRYRVGSMIAGGILIVFSFLTDKIGFSSPGSFSWGQFLLLLFGFLLLSIGLSGRRFTTYYKGVTLVIVNTIILFLLLELAAWFVINLRDAPSKPMINPRTFLPYYASQSWGKAYWQEFDTKLKNRYSPWVIWQPEPYKGTFMNINQDGIRVTPGAECDPGAYTIFFFGGSTAFGDGSPDWGTIPAYLQASLASIKQQPVCTKNFGAVGYVSTQELIELITQIQKGNKPDLVIFYDGVNEVYSAYQSGQACVHSDLSIIASEYNDGNIQPMEQVSTWLRDSFTFQLFQRLVHKYILKSPLKLTTYQTMGVDPKNLASGIGKCYLANYNLVDTLAERYGFKYAFFWQPVIYEGKKPLTSDEKTMFGNDPAMDELFVSAYPIIEQASTSHKNLYYIADVFDEQVQLIWNDGMHVTPVGNQLIAQAMLQKLGIKP